MIDPNELREMADEIDHNIELEQEKLRQEEKAREIEGKRRKHEEVMANSDEDDAIDTATLTSLTSIVSTLNQVQGALINSVFFH